MEKILILDFGSQYSHLITRRCRELNVYCEMLPCTQKIKDLDWKPKGIILSGSPYSVYDEVAPRVDPDVFTAGVPVAPSLRSSRQSEGHLRAMSFAPTRLLRLGRSATTEAWPDS